MEASSKEVQQLQRTLQVQESDLKALKYQLDEKESMVSDNTRLYIRPLPVQRHLQQNCEMITIT